MTKLCKDCKYCEPNITKVLWMNFIDYKYAKCKGSNAVNLVDGSGGAFCDIERMYESLPEKCGRQGKFWESK